MSEHPPPAPDWVLGDDGHWKPPPFTSGPSASAPRPAVTSTPAPGAVAPTATGPVPRSGPSALLIVGIVLGVVAVAGVAVLGLGAGVTYLGTTAETRLERLDGPGSASGSGLTPIGPGADGPADVPVDLPTSEPVPGEPTGTPGADAADHCPPPEQAVAAAGQDSMLEPHWERINPITFDLNGVRLVGALCDYGTVRVGRWPDAEEDVLLRLLRAPHGDDDQVGNGGLEVPSVRIRRAPAGATRYDFEDTTGSVYFEVDGTLYSASINGGTDDEVDALAGLVIDRVQPA